MQALDPTWVHATATRNFCHADSLLDWLHLYGQSSGFQRDDELPGYDPETDMGLFMREKGREFEAAVMACIRDKFEVVQIASRAGDAQRPDFYEKTIEAMERGPEILYQPVVWDTERKTYGIPDLLVRSDVLNRLVDLPPMSADDLAQKIHYRVVDIKFTSLGLNAKGLLGNDAGERRHKAQLLVYNRALGQMQGFEPPSAYLLGRSWKQTIKGVTSRGDSCFDRLAAADMLNPETASLVDDACSWIRRVRQDGASWSVLPLPTVVELYPNVGNTQDSPWHAAKKRIADEIGEVTLLWQVSPKHRPAAHAEGVICFRDDRCKATLFGIADSYEQKLQKILDAQRGPATVQPDTIQAARSEWHTPHPLEFYVDFETVTDLDDDFADCPERGGQPLIFMIGCGHMQDGAWSFRVFTCDRLTPTCELSIIEAWHRHMADVRARLSPGEEPLIFHWSHAEVSFLDSAYNSARERHKADWPPLNWYDFLGRVVREEPVVVTGALAFGLKHVAKAMKKNGFIQTSWDDGPGDGLGAMVGAWRCDRKAAENEGSMRDHPLMSGIEKYNEVDCKVMQEIVAYLRLHH